MTIDLTVPIDPVTSHLPRIYLAISSSHQHQIALFWSVFLAFLGALVFLLVWRTSRQRSTFLGRLDGLREAAEETLALVDAAVAELDQAAGSGKSIEGEAARDHSEALALRNRARSALDRPASPESLGQANEDAAHAVLLLQSIRRHLKLDGAAPGNLDFSRPRCFYCAHDDRPPYTQRTVEADRGHSMNLQFCTTCASHLERGRTPQIATVGSGAVPIPWYAAPDQAWYLPYGGPAWQYWLPLLIGMDCAGWFSGGWRYAADWRDPVARTEREDAEDSTQAEVHAGSAEGATRDGQDDAKDYDITAST
jgi:hypothetical protein